MKKFIFNFALLFFPVFPMIGTNNAQKDTVKTKEIEIVSEKQDSTQIPNILLDLIPDKQFDEFSKVLRDFAEPRGFDWELILLLMYCESGLNPQQEGIYLKSYCGLIMFGKEARKHLKISKKKLLKMNFVEQAKLAVKLWESIESWGESYKIKDFSTLQLATFCPAWIPFDGKPYPATKDIKKYNKPFVGYDGYITKESILDFFRRKIEREPNLAYYRGKI